MTRLERYYARPVAAITLIDHFAQVRATRGPMPVPIAPLRFRLVAQEINAVMTPLDPPIVLDAQTGPSGAAYLLTGEVRNGRYRLRIEGDYYAPHELIVDWPIDHTAVPAQLLRPGVAYPFPDTTLPSARITLLRGTVLSGANGTPVPNANVRILNPANLGPFTTSVTDANGAFVLAYRHANMNDIAATVRIAIPNQPVQIVPNVTLKAGQDNTLTQTSLRGSVIRANGTPVRDAQISVDLVPNQTVRTSAQGRWSFYFGLNQANAAAQVTAATPDGNAVTNVAVVQRAAVAVPTIVIG